VHGVDEEFMKVSGLEIERGRNFSPIDIQDSRHVAIIGHEVASKLFLKNESPIDRFITVGSGKYRVIGVLENKGSGFGGGPNRSVYLHIPMLPHTFRAPE